MPWKSESIGICRRKIKSGNFFFHLNMSTTITFKVKIWLIWNLNSFKLNFFFRGGGCKGGARVCFWRSNEFLSFIYWIYPWAWQGEIKEIFVMLRLELSNLFNGLDLFFFFLNKCNTLNKKIKSHLSKQKYIFYFNIQTS